MRVGVIGLMHGHVAGFFHRVLSQDDVVIVGIAEPDVSLARRYAAEFHLNEKLFYMDADKMIRETKPDTAWLCIQAPWTTQQRGRAI